MSRLIPDTDWGIVTVQQEAEGSRYENKVRVAEVILHRTQQKYRSDGSVASTVLWAMQFSGWNAKAYDGNVKKFVNNAWRIACAKADDSAISTQDCVRAWDEAIGGSNLSGGALNFYSPKIATVEKPRQEEIDVKYQDEDFVFFNFVMPAHV